MRRATFLLYASRSQRFLFANRLIEIFLVLIGFMDRNIVLPVFIQFLFFVWVIRFRNGFARFE